MTNLGGLEEFINAVVLVENATGTTLGDSEEGRRGEMLICITMRPVGGRAGQGQQSAEGKGEKEREEG